VTLAMPIARPLKGSAKPRIAPPTPARSDIAGYREAAACMDIKLIEWQEIAARYLEAQGADGQHLYREAAVIAARQNGKTHLILPLLHKRLMAGRRMMHTAQDRYLPRELFYHLADHFWSAHRDLFPQRNDRATRPRYANGQEELRLITGGVYRIVAPTPIGARGSSVHDVFLDELMAMDDWGFINAAKPTMSLPDPQFVYLSNMGSEMAVVLNALRDRADKDPSLAYLEWSADPDLAADDPVAWAQANPMMGNEPPGVGPVYERLVTAHRAARLDGTMAGFETEYLCRSVPSMRETLVDLEQWQACEGVVSAPTKVFMGVSLNPEGTRASAYLAWQQGDETMLRKLEEGIGNPINVEKLGRDLRVKARQNHVTEVGFDPLTDAVLAKYFGRTKPITGQQYANASARFVTLVEGGRLGWSDCGAVTNDLTWTARKEHDESGSFQAVRANDDIPITAALAAIRAVWLASEPPFKRKPRVGVGHG
jgi:hypothetical protein